MWYGDVIPPDLRPMIWSVAGDEDCHDCGWGDDTLSDTASPQVYAFPLVPHSLSEDQGARFVRSSQYVVILVLS